MVRSSYQMFLRRLLDYTLVNNMDNKEADKYIASVLKFWAKHPAINVDILMEVIEERGL